MDKRTWSEIGREAFLNRKDKAVRAEDFDFTDIMAELGAGEQMVLGGYIEREMRKGASDAEKGKGGGDMKWDKWEARNEGYAVYIYGRTADGKWCHIGTVDKQYHEEAGLMASCFEMSEAIQRAQDILVQLLVADDVVVDSGAGERIETVLKILEGRKL